MHIFFVCITLLQSTYTLWATWCMCIYGYLLFRYFIKFIFVLQYGMFSQYPVTCCLCQPPLTILSKVCFLSSLSQSQSTVVIVCSCRFAAGDANACVSHHRASKLPIVPNYISSPSFPYMPGPNGQCQRNDAVAVSSSVSPTKGLHIGNFLTVKMELIR